jgi:hypothetical protein
MGDVGSLSAFGLRLSWVGDGLDCLLQGKTDSSQEAKEDVTLSSLRIIVSGSS